MQERKERIQSQADLRTFLEKFAPVLSSAIETIKDVEGGLSRTAEKVSAVPDRATYDMALRRLELMLSEAETLTQNLRGGASRGTHD